MIHRERSDRPDPAQWPRFEQRMQRVIEHVDAQLDDPTCVAEDALRAQACIAGCAPGEVVAPLLRTTLPEAACAVLVHTGPYASMGAAYRWLFGEWLAQSGREPADAPVVQEYLNSPRETAPADLVTHIHLLLRPRWRPGPKDSPTLARLSFDPAFIRDQRALEGLSR